MPLPHYCPTKPNSTGAGGWNMPSSARANTCRPQSVSRSASHGSERGWLPFQPTPLRSDLTQLSAAPRNKPARSAEDPGPEAVHRTRRTASWAARSGRTGPPSGRKLVHAPAGQPRSSAASRRWGSKTSCRPSGLRPDPTRSAPWTRVDGKDPNRAHQLRAEAPP